MAEQRRLRTDGVEATEALAARLGAAAQAGDTLGLVGDLGAGKTAFVRGLARGLGITGGSVTSPTFVMIAEHQGRLPLHHVDLYRLERDQIDELMLREYVYGPGVTAIEWCDRLPPGALADYLLLRIDYALEGRILDFQAHGRRAEVWLGALPVDA